MAGPGSVERFEPIEIRGIVAYLLNKSQPFEQAKPARASSRRRPIAASNFSKPAAAWPVISTPNFRKAR